MKVKEILETMEYGEAPESAEQAKAWIATRSGKMGLYIDGSIECPDGRDSWESRNPANGEVLAHLCQSDREDIDRAVNAARKAQPEWEGMGGPARAKYLYALARLVQKHSRLLAVL